MAIHKGTELNNVNETWQQNEREREQNNTPGVENVSTPSGGDSEIDRVIKEEAAEYDQANKEDRLLGGERATVSDEDGN